MSKYKICLIYPYFGKMPWYFKFFVASCKFNPDIDFIIFTDNRIGEKLPENVKVNYTTLQEVEQLASINIGFQVNIPRPYKLCDFKPAYGVIFENTIKGYDFWGHGDLDVIFGNIRNFITNEILDNHDVIAVREEYVTGFFTLFRNIPLINRLYEQSKDFKLVFRNGKNFTFDECNNLFSQLQAGQPIFELTSEVESMTHVVKRLDQQGIIRAHFDLFVVESNPGNLFWNQGQLSYNDEYEIMLYHLILFKELPSHIPASLKEVPSSYYINENYFSKLSPGSISGKIEKLFVKGYLSLKNIKRPSLPQIEKNIPQKDFDENEAFEEIEVMIVSNDKKIIRKKKKALTDA